MLNQTLLIDKNKQTLFIDKLKSNVHEMNLISSNYYFDLDIFELLQI